MAVLDDHSEKTLTLGLFEPSAGDKAVTETLENAQIALLEAIDQEDFEEAARLRDIIRETKKENENNEDTES